MMRVHIPTESSFTVPAGAEASVSLFARNAPPLAQGVRGLVFSGDRHEIARALAHTRVSTVLFLLFIVDAFITVRVVFCAEL